jgi:hypothetical protein
MKEKLHVIAVHSNPVRYATRTRLTHEFLERTARQCGDWIDLYLVECCLGDRRSEIIPPSEVKHGALKTRTQIWNKEALINIAVRDMLPRDWKYLAWVDADVQFVRDDWAEETLHALQHWPIVQPWQHCTDLGPNQEMAEKQGEGVYHRSFGYMVGQVDAGRRGSYENAPYHFRHPGFAWACTRALWENVGGLIDFAVLGAADHHMAWGLVGKFSTVPAQLTGYASAVRAWGQRAFRYAQGHVGYVPGLLLHHWHGRKRDRQYRERWDALTKHGFDPEQHLLRDSQGMPEWSSRAPAGLVADVRDYFWARNEDNIDLD